MATLYERQRAQLLARIPTSGGFFACWPMQTKRPDGYAVCGAGNLMGTGESYSHRIVYRLVWGPIPEGYEVDHVCRTRNCVNPLHLEAITLTENRRRQIQPYSARTHCPQGHPYSGDNLRVYKNKRYCKTCIVAANRTRRARL